MGVHLEREVTAGLASRAGGMVSAGYKLLKPLDLPARHDLGLSTTGVESLRG